MYYFRFIESHTAQTIKQQLTSLAVICSMFHNIVPEHQIHEHELLNHISFSQLKRCLIKSVSVVDVLFIYAVSCYDCVVSMIYDRICIEHKWNDTERRKLKYLE
jgi:hypothetical protein